MSTRLCGVASTSCRSLTNRSDPTHSCEEKLKAEAPGYPALDDRGALDWQVDGLVRPARDGHDDEYFEDQDLLGQWLEDECECTPDNPYRSKLLSSVLYTSWKSFAGRTGEDIRKP